MCKNPVAEMAGCPVIEVVDALPVSRHRAAGMHKSVRPPTRLLLPQLHGGSDEFVTDYVIASYVWPPVTLPT